MQCRCIQNINIKKSKITYFLPRFSYRDQESISSHHRIIIIIIIIIKDQARHPRKSPEDLNRGPRSGPLVGSKVQHPCPP